jgi:peptidoglycan/LPS O-acetylase OafA/YrhL
MRGVFNPLMAAVIAALILALLRPVAALPMALLITAVLAGLSHRYLEAPLMQLGRRGS